MFRLNFQIIFRTVVQEIFILKVFEAYSDSKAQIFVPDIGETEFARMIFISGIVCPVTMIVDIDIIVFEEITEIKVSHLHWFQSIVYTGGISFS